MHRTKRGRVPLDPVCDPDRNLCDGRCKQLPSAVRDVADRLNSALEDALSGRTPQHWAQVELLLAFEVLPQPRDASSGAVVFARREATYFAIACR